MEIALIIKSIFVLRYRRQRSSDVLLKDWERAHHLKKQLPPVSQISLLELHFIGPGGCQSWNSASQSAVSHQHHTHGMGAARNANSQAPPHTY